MFDTKSWLRTHIADGYELNDDTWAAAAGLTLLWSLFEKRFCNGEAGTKAFEQLANSFGISPLPKEVADAYEFWAHRYVENGNTNNRFAELFHRPDGKKIVEPILLSQNASTRERFLANLVIVYRLWNNLFHGNKELRTLNAQFENLDRANRVLTSVMEFFSIT